MIKQQLVLRGWQMFVTVMLAMISQSAMATTYTYTAPNSTTTNTWSSGTAWSAVPVSAFDTTLVFAGSFSSGVTATAQDNIAGAFQLNTMTLGASNSGVFTTANYNITTTGGTLNFINNGATTAVVNLNSNNGGNSANINTTVSINASIDGGSLTFQGNGSGGSTSNGFVFSGILSDGATAANVIKNGSSVLTLSGANTFTGGLTMNAGALYINNAKAVGTGTMTVAGGTINNTSGSAITLFTNVAQSWTGNFSWGGSNDLNLGTGAVTLSGNRAISLLNGSTSSFSNGSASLTVGGIIADGGSNYSLSFGNAGRINTQTLVLGNTANTYGGGTVIDSGILQAAAVGSLGASGANVSVNYGGTLSAGYAIDQATLQKLTANSTGTVALAGVNSSNNLDFSSAGVNLPVSLGATGTATYSGTLTPQGQTYRLGGGFGNLIMANALGDVNAAPTALVIGSGGSSGTVTLNSAATYTGGTTVTGIPGSTASVLQTNILTGVSNTPFGASNSSILLNNGTLGFGSAATLSSGNVMNVSGYNVTFDSGTIKLSVGSGTSVTYTANSLNQSSLGGVLYLAPTSAASLGTTEKVFVANASSTIPLTVTNGMVSPKIIDATNRTFVTYDSVKGFSDAATTTLYGANNVVSIGTDPNATISAYALRTTAVMQSSDNFTLGAGGFLSNGSQNNAAGTINFGSTPGYYGIYGGGNVLTSFNATAGVTFYGTGMGFTGANLNIQGGITFASGAWSFTPQPTGSEVFQTANPNALIILSGASITESQGSKMTFASIEGSGSINESLSNAFTLTINGLNSTGTKTFSGLINGATGGTGNIVKTGTNTQVFSGLNTYNGTTTISGGTLKGTQTSGTPFGLGSVTIGNGVMSLAPSGSGANVALTGANLATGSTFTFNAGAQMNLDKGSNTSLSYTVGNTSATANSVLVRGTNGTMIVAPASGIANLGTGSGEKFIVNGGVTTTNGIVSAAIIGQDNDSNKSGTFLGYNGTNGLVGGTYTDTNFTSASSSSVEDVTSATSVNTQTVFALRSSAALTLNASQTLTVGSNSASVPAGVILNGGSINGGTALAFGAAPAVVYSSLANGSIGSVITGSGGVSVTGPGVTTFSGSNTFSGGLLINNTTLSASSNGNLGTAAGALTLNGGTLQSTATFSLGTRAVTLNIGQTNYGGVFDVASGTTLTAAGVLSGSGGLIKANTGTLTLSGVNTFTGFTVVNAGTLNLSNASALASSTLTTGGTVFDSSVGSHAFTFGGLSGSGALSLMDNASNAVALSVGNNNSTTTYSGVMSGTGSLVKIGTGTLTLTGASTYTGATSIQGGTLAVSSLNKVVGGTASSSLGAPTTSGSGTIAIGTGATGATLSYVGAGETTDRIIDQSGTTGGATVSANGTGALILAGNITASGAGIKTLTLSGSSATNVLNEVQGVISDSSAATSVTKSGVGTWVLSGLNTYTGTTTISGGGTLMLGAAGNATNSALGTTAAGTTVSSGGVLDLNGFTLGTAEALTINGSGLFNNASGTGALVNSSSTAATYSGLVTLGSASKIFAGNGDIILSNTGTITGAGFGLTLDGTSTGSSIASIIGTTTGGVTKTGTGTWTLSGANTYTGTTTVNQGTLLLDKTGSGALATTSALTLGGGNFQVKAASSGTTTQTLGALTLSANTNSVITLDPNGGIGMTLTLGNTWTRGAGSSLLFDYSSANSGTRTVATAAATTGATLTNGIYGWGLVKDSAGVTGFATRDGSGNISRYDDTTGTTLAIASNTGTSNFTTLNSVYSSGTLTWTNGGALTARSVNSLTIDTTNSGGTIDMGASSNILTLTSLGILFKGANNEILTGGQVGAAASEVIIHQTGTGLLTINSLISSGAGSLTKDGTGTLVVGGANTYTGATTINAGTLRLGSAGSGANGPLGTVAAGTTVNSGGALDVNGFTLATAEALTLRGTGVSNGGALTNSSATAATYSGLVTLGANASIVASNGNINLSNTGTITGNGFGLTLGGTATGSSIASVIGTGNGGVTKTDNGTWNLTGVNTYTGATTVTGGTLLVNGSINGSTVTVATGGTLGGSGSSGAVIVQSGGTLAPGNSPGLYTSASLTLNGGANYALQLMSDGTGVAGTNWDSYVATGALDITALSSGSTFVFKLETLANATTPGLLGSWDGSVNHTWANVIDYGSLTGTYASNLFSVDTTSFANTFTGTFSIVQNGTALDLQYIAAVPEPSTYAMVGLGLLSLWALRRKKAKVA